jgi:hypothetical protein
MGPDAAALNAADAREWLRCARSGDLAAAWQVSDRIRLRDGNIRDWTAPRHQQRVWDGSSFQDRRVLIRCYHGLGDTIQFIRYVPCVRAISREVTVWAQPSLLPLLISVAGIDRLLPLHDGAPDCHCDVDVEIMELPYAFRSTLSTIPVVVPYLHIDSMPLSGDRPRVGIVWRAGDWDQARSISFNEVRRLFDQHRVSWYALQLGRTADEHHPQLRDAPAGDVASLARTITALDLVITIDSMPAHLAGALGVPVWTLLPQAADWRWMEDRTDSPWYPTMRLFRQRGGGWTPVMDTVLDALAEVR